MTISIPAITTYNDRNPALAGFNDDEYNSAALIITNDDMAANLFVDVTVGDITMCIGLAELIIAVQAFDNFRKMVDPHILHP